MPAPVSAIAGVLARSPGREEPGAQTQVVDLREVWAQVTDPRDRRGRRHRLVVILALVQAAVVSGATGLAAIRHWIGAAPQHVLADAGALRSPRTGRYQAPHPDTVCRVLERLDPAEVDAAYARYQAARLPELYDDPDELVPVTVDGKSQRGTADGKRGSRARHRLGAMLAQDGITLAQLDVDGKSNEISAFIPLLDQIGDLTNMVISADMMHTQREHARYLHRRGAHFVRPSAPERVPSRQVGGSEALLASIGHRTELTISLALAGPSGVLGLHGTPTGALGMPPVEASLRAGFSPSRCGRCLPGLWPHCLRWPFHQEGPAPRAVKQDQGDTVTTQTTENGTIASSPEEGTVYLVILTLQRPTLFGFRVVTCEFTAWATPSTSRRGLLELAKAELPKRWRKGNISFFYAEPDHLGGTA